MSRRFGTSRRVPPAGSFSPLSLSPVAFLQSDLGIALNGSTVSAWADQTTNGNNFTQATSTNQPIYNGKDTVLGNLPSVQEPNSGSNRFLACINANLVGLSGLSVTIFWVGYMAAYCSRAFGDASNYFTGFTLTSGTCDPCLEPGGSGAVVGSNVGYGAAVAYCATIQPNGNCSLYVDNSQTAVGTAGPSANYTSLANWSLLNAQGTHFGVTLGSYGIFNNFLTASQRAQLFGWAAIKYGGAWS